MQQTYPNQMVHLGSTIYCNTLIFLSPEAKGDGNKKHGSVGFLNMVILKS